MSELLLDNPATFHDPVWGPATYRCHICLTREDDGGFSAVVLNLPGCGSCGTTREEAIQNVREAIRGVVASHVELGEDIPWCNSMTCEIPKDADQKWIIVNA